MKNESMQTQELALAVENALKDEFVAKVTRDGKEIRLEFFNGQAFKIKIEQA